MIRNAKARYIHVSFSIILWPFYSSDCNFYSFQTITVSQISRQTSNFFFFLFSLLITRLLEESKELLCIFKIQFKCFFPLLHPFMNSYFLSNAFLINVILLAPYKYLQFNSHQCFCNSSFASQLIGNKARSLLLFAFVSQGP